MHAMRLNVSATGDSPNGRTFHMASLGLGDQPSTRLQLAVSSIQVPMLTSRHPIQRHQRLANREVKAADSAWHMKIHQETIATTASMKALLSLLCPYWGKSPNGTSFLMWQSHGSPKGKFFTLLPLDISWHLLTSQVADIFPASSLPLNIPCRWHRPWRCLPPVRTPAMIWRWKKVA